MSESQRGSAHTPLEEDGNEAAANFLERFPAQREEIEKCIRCLQELADNIDKTHKDCTITSIAASSGGAVSGILTILGLALTPVTAGGSLILTLTGVSLGTASAATGITGSLCERFINSNKRKKAEELINKCDKILNQCRESLCSMMHLDDIDFKSGFPPNNWANRENVHCLMSSSNTVRQIPKLATTVKKIASNVKALKYIEDNPVLKTVAMEAAAAGSTSRAAIKGIDQVEEVFKGTTLAMTKGARVMGLTFAAAFLLFDAYCIVKDAIHLTKGAKGEIAAGIREKASNLEKVLQDLINHYQKLKEAM
ncbi:apolipoprotein L6-like isoform X2 [Elgaria multicarinata webbii]|uniref:apolipoprotein L6-like isoform X2 n=1 Tax=Elgaria multicarinata webbii TaxID=159646 RepID=UPI002FCD48ED